MAHILCLKWEGLAKDFPTLVFWSHAGPEVMPDCNQSLSQQSKWCGIHSSFVLGSGDSVPDGDEADQDVHNNHGIEMHY